jgi:PAS domain-containing protein
VTAVSFPTSLADLEAMALPTIVLDLGGTIIALNTAAIRLGARQRHEIVGMSASEFAPGIEYLWDERVAAGRSRSCSSTSSRCTSSTGSPPSSPWSPAPDL